MSGADRPRAPRPAAALLALALAATAGTAGAVVLTGEVRATDAQILYTPFSNSSPTVIRFFVAEGESVKKGDPVLRIDPGQSASQLPELDAQIEQAEATAAKALAELQVKALEAEAALVDAQAELETARLDAGLPRALVSGLDYDRYQGEFDRTTREAALLAEQLAAARDAVARQREDSALEVKKLRLKRDYFAALAANAEVRATRDGVVVHGYNNNWLGGRIDEGSSAMPGNEAGQVVAPGSAMQVRAWALEPDRRGLRVGQAVRLAFDALPGRSVDGRIRSIAGAPEPRAEWGDGSYFVVDIDLPPKTGLPLLPGMSVRVLASTPAAGNAGVAP
jgi:multidrug resistance efflux pump